MPTYQSDRRTFVKSGLLGMGSLLMLPSCMKGYAPWEFLTEKEARCLLPICEHIIPADEHGPGATYAGVIFYIDRQLAKVFHQEQEMYRQGIHAIQRCAIGMHEESYEALDSAFQLRFLENMESGKLPSEFWADGPDQPGFFRTLVRHTMQGFYGSPRHGGNKNYISYRLMKLDYPYVVGQNRYRELQKRENYE